MTSSYGQSVSLSEAHGNVLSLRRPALLASGCFGDSKAVYVRLHALLFLFILWFCSNLGPPLDRVNLPSVAELKLSTPGPDLGGEEPEATKMSGSATMVSMVLHLTGPFSAMLWSLANDAMAVVILGGSPLPLSFSFHHISFSHWCLVIYGHEFEALSILARSAIPSSSEQNFQHI